MNLKKSLLISGLIAATTLAGSAWADKGDRYGRHDYARVTAVDPIVRTVSHRVPRESCWQEEVRYEEPVYRSPTGALLGGIIGAAIGNELGHHKRNKQIGALAGGALGASIGYDLTRHNGPSRVDYRTEERCETRYDVEYEEQIVGYDVTYRYHGQLYHTRMDRHPGKRIPVKVKVRPAY